MNRILRPIAVGTSVLLLAGCSLFGSGRADPPPYPNPVEASSLKVSWHERGLARAAPGFQPAVVDDALWVAAVDGTVRRLDRANGRTTLQVRLPERLGSGVAADRGIVVVVSRDGEVFALDPSGKIRWRRPLISEVTTPPVVAESVVVVRTQDGRIVALDRDGGTVRWTWQRQMPPLTLRQSAPMVVQDDALYAGLPGARVVAIDLRIGAPRWETVIASPRGTTELERLVDVVGLPAVSSSEICVVAYQGKLACLRPDNGQVLWTRDIASSAGLALAGGTVVTVDASDIIQSLGAQGDASWKQEGYVRRNLTTPVIDGRRVLFGDRFGSLSSLALDDGRTLARVAAGSTAFASPPVVERGMAYGQTVGGDVIAVAIPR